MQISLVVKQVLYWDLITNVIRATTVLLSMRVASSDTVVQLVLEGWCVVQRHSITMVAYHAVQVSHGYALTHYAIQQILAHAFTFRN